MDLIYRHQFANRPIIGVVLQFRLFGVKPFLFKRRSKEVRALGGCIPIRDCVKDLVEQVGIGLNEVFKLVVS